MKTGSTDSARFWDGEDDFVNAFNYGDIIKNQTQTATNVTGVVKNSNTVATITVASTTNISLNHM